MKSHLSAAYLNLGARSRKDAVALILDPHAGWAPGSWRSPKATPETNGWELRSRLSPGLKYATPPVQAGPRI